MQSTIFASLSFFKEKTWQTSKQLWQWVLLKSHSWLIVNFNTREAVHTSLKLKRYNYAEWQFQDRTKPLGHNELCVGHSGVQLMWVAFETSYQIFCCSTGWQHDSCDCQSWRQGSSARVWWNKADLWRGGLRDPPISNTNTSGVGLLSTNTGTNILGKEILYKGLSSSLDAARVMANMW